MYTIKPQPSKASDTIDTLLDAAFGEGRQSKRSYHFRQSVRDEAKLRFVTTMGNRLVGTIRFWPVSINDDTTNSKTPALLLGPLGVAPDLQGRGIGADLINHGLIAARNHHHTIVILVGDLTYYGRFGFGAANVAHGHHITMPGEQQHRVLIRELVNGALDGVNGAITSLADQAR